jgi:membrane protein required for colicin V production
LSVILLNASQDGMTPPPRPAIHPADVRAPTPLGPPETMPSLLDIALIVVMLISGLLAMVRGFMREVLSITAWVLAAGATLYAFPKLQPFALSYFGGSTVVASIAVVGGVFLVTLLIVSVLTIRVSDMVLDSRVGALDRTLGFLFGLGRGFIVVLVAFIFFTWLVAERSQPDWIKNAKSLTVLEKAKDSLTLMLPENLEGLYQRYKGRRDAPDPQDTPPDRRGEVGGPADNRADAGYDRGSRVGMEQLVQAKRAAP